MIKIINSKSNIALKKIINPRYYRGFFRLKSFIVITGILVFSLSFFACNEMDEIGLDLIDNPLQSSSTDTITLIAYTQMEDSLITNRNDLSLLGFINDPVFGKTGAGIYTEALPRKLPPTFAEIHPDSLRIDSVIMSMVYVGYFGDTTQTHHVRVFELDEVIPSDSTIYSNRQLETREEIMVYNAEFLPFPTDSVFLGIDNEPSKPQLRIRLDNELGRRFIEDQDTLGEMSINEDFRSYFKGFYLSIEELAQPGSMLFFNLRDSLSKFTIYYGTQGVEDQYTLNFFMSDPVARRYNHYEDFDHQFVDPNIETQIFNTDTLMGDSLLFVQSMSNFRVKIQLPYMQNFLEETQGDIAINSARLIIPVEDDYLQDTLELARNLLLFREDPLQPGNIISLDDQFVAPGYFGGQLDTLKREYSFNITRHLQGVIDDASMNTPLYLRVSGAAQNAGRVVLNGPGREQPMRLEIRYTQPNTN